MYILGLHSDGEYFKVCLLGKTGKKIRIEFLKEFKKDISNLNVLKKILDKRVTFFRPSIEVVTGLTPEEIFVKKFSFPLTNKSKVKKALEFQLSSDEIYKEEGRFFIPTFTKKEEETEVTLYGYTRETMEHHVQNVKTLGIDSEWISTITTAFERFVSHFVDIAERFYLFHLGWETSYYYLMEGSKAIKEVSFQIGFKNIIDAVQKDQVVMDNLDIHSISKIIGETIERGSQGAIFDVYNELEKEISRAWTYMVETDKSGVEVSKILFTGYADLSKSIKHLLPPLDFQEIAITPHLEYNSMQTASYAIEIGLALDRAMHDKKTLQLGRGSFLPSVQKKKARASLYRFLSLSTLSALMFFFLFDVYYLKKSAALKKEYEARVDEIYSYGDAKPPTLKYTTSFLELNRRKLAQFARKEKQKLKETIGPVSMAELITWLEPYSLEDFDISVFDYKVVETPKALNSMQSFIIEVYFEVLIDKNKQAVLDLKEKLLKPAEEIEFAQPIQFELNDEKLSVLMRVKG